MKLSKNRKGLTLIELLIVVLILGALAAIAIPRMAQNSTTAKQRACETNRATMNTQIELFHANSATEAWPDLETDIRENTDLFPDGVPTCPSSGVYDMNSTSHHVDCDATGH